ncbi:hypothetical protein ACIGPN_06045 [Streptomyces afghaniensis]|uniref:hypothetical protein n=1 Tax=Streptomyces afghaniensis TaxID=66865 RepID=UPI0037D38D6A
MAQPVLMDAVAARADIWRTAHKLISDGGYDEVEPYDTLRLAEWLAGEEFS